VPFELYLEKQFHNATTPFFTLKSMTMASAGQYASNTRPVMVSSGI
jgi:hypothetical protein